MNCTTTSNLCSFDRASLCSSAWDCQVMVNTVGFRSSRPALRVDIWSCSLHIAFLKSSNMIASEAGKMVQWLRAFVLVEDLCSVPRTHMASHTVYASSSRASVALFWSPKVSDTCTAYIHTCKQSTHIQNIINVPKMKIKPPQKYSSKAWL